MRSRLQAPADSGGSAAAAPASVLHELNSATRALERLLGELRGTQQAETALRSLARQLCHTVRRDPDVALASIFLNQLAGMYTVRHCVETAIVVALLEDALDKPQDEIDTATVAALTMNAAMIKEAERFQSKSGMLDAGERAIVARHPAEGAHLLREAGVHDDVWLDYVLRHHEHADGSGYPEGLRGDAIPENAKLIGLADRYCAHVSARNYRRSLLPPAALQQLLEAESGLDARLAELFRTRLGPYPPGTLVRLENGASGVVTRRDAAGTPLVYVLQPAAEAGVRSTAEEGWAISAALPEDALGMRFAMKQVWGAAAAL